MGEHHFDGNVVVGWGTESIPQSTDEFWNFHGGHGTRHSEQYIYSLWTTGGIATAIVLWIDGRHFLRCHRGMWSLEGGTVLGV